MGTWLLWLGIIVYAAVALVFYGFWRQTVPKMGPVTRTVMSLGWPVVLCVAAGHALGDALKPLLGKASE